MQPPTPTDPADEQEPAGAPMLDALEQSIVHPPGFEDLLPAARQRFMDETARMLESLETSIEGPVPWLTAGWEVPDEGQPPPAAADTGEENDDPPPDAVEADPPPFDPGMSDTGPPVPNMDAPTMAPRDVMRPGARRGGSSGPRARPWHPPPRSFRGTRTMARAGGPRRYCPDSRDLIDEAQCPSCEKYRHWPDGTDEEPRMCWHDWEARPGKRRVTSRTPRNLRTVRKMIRRSSLHSKGDLALRTVARGGAAALLRSSSSSICLRLRRKRAPSRGRKRGRTLADE